MLKCPKCQAVHKLRLSQTCACSYQFVFTKTDPISDPGMLAIIKRASRGDTYYFTANRLYGEYCAMKKTLVPGEIERRWNSGCSVLAFATLACVPMTLLVSSFFWILGLGLLWLTFASRTKVKLTEDRWLPPNRDTFDQALRKWNAAGREPVKLLSKPRLGNGPVYRSIEDDIHDYGVEKIIITSDDLLVDLLVKNHAHAEQKALIVAESGYPAYLQDKVKKTLRMRPDVPVILLHNADVNGVTMAGRLRSSQVYPLAQANLIDAGINVSQVRRSAAAKAVAQDQEYPVAVDVLPYPAMLAGLSSALVGGFAAQGALLPAHVDAATNKHKDGHADSGGSGGDSGWSDDGHSSNDGNDAAGDFSGSDSGDGGDGDFG
jgi:hypothetical protein